MIIDSHAHIFAPHIIQNREDYANRDRCFGELYNHAKAKMATVEELVASMDRHHIDMSVVCNIGWTKHELCVESNDYLIESINRYPKRLLGLVAVQPNAGDKALKELERCTEPGIRGIGEMRPDIQGFDMTNDKLLTPLVNCLVQRDLIWLNHASDPIGHTYPGKGGLTPQVIYPFIKRFPQLKVVLAHWGGGLPFYTLMPEVRLALKNVYYDTAASIYLYESGIYPQVINLVGANHVLFGSDFPLMSHNRPLKELKGLNIAESDKNLIAYQNAKRLLGIN